MSLDNRPPVIKSAFLQYDEEQHAFILKFLAEDIGSGIDSVSYGITNTLGVQTSGMSATFNPSSGLYEATFSLPDQTPNGEWTLTGIWVTDKAGNLRLYRGDQYSDRVSSIPIILPNDEKDLFLSDNSKQMTLTCSGDIRIYGNSSNNRLTGNAGNNLLNGKGGIDVMKGKAGDDT